MILMKKFRSKIVKKIENEVELVICNCCSLEISASDWVGLNKLHQISVSGEYGSNYPGDGVILSFDVCESCLQQWISSFKIEPESL